MGEQDPGAHAEKVVRRLVKSWEKLCDIRQTWVNPSSAREAPGNATPSKSPDSAGIIVRVVVNGKVAETIDVHFHEAWWADLGQRTGFMNWLRFLVWLLCSPWALLFKGKDNQYDEEDWMERAVAAGMARLKSPRSGFFGRLGQFLVLGFFSLFALATVLTWGALRRLLQRFAPSPVVLLQYFGDVQAYQEGGRPDTGTGRDMALPPRVPIRRRMVEEMVAMAEREYDRWYVMAHSLGSIVAVNGLMEPDYLLSNYLRKKHWHRLDKRFKAVWRRPDTKDMRPRRPTWLKPHDAIAREELFRKLGGLVTYGSPLHLFVDLWPHIVLVNSKKVFPEDCEWINLYSPFDPVSGALRAFAQLQWDAGAGHPLPLRSFCLSESRRSFIAHNRYLDGVKKAGNLGAALGNWWLRGQKVTIVQGSYWSGWLWSFVQIVVGAAAVGVPAAAEIAVICTLASEAFSHLLDYLCCR